MFIRSLKAEYIKTKASGLKWLSLGAAIFIPLIQFLFYVIVSETVYVNKPQNPWMDFINGSIGAFTPFFYPLLCVLIVVRLAQFEHRADAWKLLETQPISKAALYFSKWLMCLLLALACLLLLLLLSVLFVFLLSLIKGDAEYSTSAIDWGEALWFIVKIWISGFGLMALQYLLSIAIANFVAPFVLGLIATIAGTILGQFGIMSWWPYTAPQNTVSYYNQSNDWLLPHEQLSILFMLLFLFLGFRLFTYKKVKYAVIKPASRIIAVAGCIALFAFGFFFLNRPKQFDRGSNTVIAGEIDSKEKISTLYLLDPGTRDTVQVIPVHQNRFAAQVKKDIPPTYYYLRIGSDMKQVFLGKGDSLYIDIAMSEMKNEFTVTGTRIAENSYATPSDFNDNFWYLENMAYRYKPKQYANNVLDEWEQGEQKIDEYHTVSNIKPSDDFIQMQKKLLRLRLLQLLDHHYPQVFRVYYPNDTLKYPKEVDAFRKAATLNDESLMFSDNYIQFLDGYYRKTSRAITDSSYYGYVVKNFPAGKAKDIFLFRSLSEFIARVSDSARRQYFINTFGKDIASSKLFAALNEKNKTMNSMKRGKPAPEIHAETLNGQPFVLSSLKNRFIVIDVWATWCGPCKKEAPYFKELAERYTSETVAFVSLSIDEKKNDWKVDAIVKAEKVLQLWATNATEELHKNYNIESIPRFILIDNKGRVVNAQMPRPSDPEFESILVKETAAYSR